MHIRDLEAQADAEKTCLVNKHWILPVGTSKLKRRVDTKISLQTLTADPKANNRLANPSKTP